MLPILLFQIQTIQFFHYQNYEEMTRNIAPYKIYWQDTVSKNTYGPFPTLKEAMDHHTYTIATAPLISREEMKNVIYVDFTTKKRVPPDNTVA